MGIDKWLDRRAATDSDSDRPDRPDSGSAIVDTHTA